MLKIIRLCYESNHRFIHNSSCLYLRRHSRPGATSDVGLKELIVDKPPNEYPTLQQKLNRINYYDNPKRIKNIGFDNETNFYQNFINQSNNIIAKQKETMIENGDDDEYDDDNKKLIDLCREDYNKLSSYYSFTEQYLESTVQLAHHYGIFRDLFFQEPFMNESCKDLIIANAKDEVKFHKFENRELYYFNPLVPIKALFSKNSNEEEELTYLQSFRGNLILPEYGKSPPKIQLNTSGINNNIFNVNELILSTSNLIIINSGEKIDKNYYTLALINLDSHFSDTGVCHWMISNINQTDNNETNYDLIIDYLPIYGIRGLGYHRYVFVLFQSDNKISHLERINDFDIGRRKFNGLEFMSKCFENNTNIKPIGLSWFQTTWSDYCKSIFHDILDMRCPTYEYIYPKQSTKFDQLQFPGRAPFNLYLDSFRDPKDLSKEVLLERLKTIDPMKSYDTDKMFQTWEGRPKFPHIHPFPKNTPDWLKSTLIRKRAHEGRFRGLRSSSAILPHNNNADLDKPKWPRISPDVNPINVPNPYPDGKKRPKPLRETLWTKPLPEHHSVRVDFPENLQDVDKSNYEKTPSSSSSSQ